MERGFWVEAGRKAAARLPHSPKSAQRERRCARHLIRHSAQLREEVAGNTTEAVGSIEAGHNGGDAGLDFLRDDGADGVDGEAGGTAHNAGFGAGTVSHCEPVWIV